MIKKLLIFFVFVCVLCLVGCRTVSYETGFRDGKPYKQIQVSNFGFNTSIGSLTAKTEEGGELEFNDLNSSADKSLEVASKALDVVSARQIP